MRWILRNYLLNSHPLHSQSWLETDVFLECGTVQGFPKLCFGEIWKSAKRKGVKCFGVRFTTDQRALTSKGTE